MHVCICAHTHTCMHIYIHTCPRTSFAKRIRRIAAVTQHTVRHQNKLQQTAHTATHCDTLQRAIHTNCAKSRPSSTLRWIQVQQPAIEDALQQQLQEHHRAAVPDFPPPAPPRKDVQQQEERFENGVGKPRSEKASECGVDHGSCGEEEEEQEEDEEAPLSPEWLDEAPAMADAEREKKREREAHPALSDRVRKEGVEGWRCEVGALCGSASGAASNDAPIQAVIDLLQQALERAMVQQAVEQRAHAAPLLSTPVTTHNTNVETTKCAKIASQPEKCQSESPSLDLFGEEGREGGEGCPVTPSRRRRVSKLNLAFGRPQEEAGKSDNKSTCISNKNKCDDKCDDKPDNTSDKMGDNKRDNKGHVTPPNQGDVTARTGQNVGDTPSPGVVEKDAFKVSNMQIMSPKGNAENPSATRAVKHAALATRTTTHTAPRTATLSLSRCVCCCAMDGSNTGTECYNTLCNTRCNTRCNTHCNPLSQSMCLLFRSGR